MSLASPAPFRCRAFTLVEILIALAITIVLGAALMAVMRSALDGAKMTQSLSNLKQLVTANAAYAADRGRFCPADDRWNNRRWHGARNSVSEPFKPEQGFLSPYLGKSGKVGICPLFREMLTDSRSFELSTGGYGYNASYIGGTPDWSWNAEGIRVSAMPSQIARMSTVMFTTSGYANGDSIQEYPYCEPPFWDFGGGPTAWRPSPTVHFRFRGKALVAWCDGRVTAEASDPRDLGINPHHGNAARHNLGWFGPDAQNGFWNPRRSE